MFGFKKKKRLYPSVYSEWIREFKRMDAAFLTEQDYEMLKGGGLEDSKHSLEIFENELNSFLELQISFFFKDLARAVEQNLDENNAEYILLLIRRYNLKYAYLYFFEDFKFLPEQYRKDLKGQLAEKLKSFDKELAAYFDKLSLYSASMSDISLNIKRLIEV